jgi:hypothetical protein
MAPTFNLLNHLRNSFGEKSFVNKSKNGPNGTDSVLTNVEGVRTRAVEPVVKQIMIWMMKTPTLSMMRYDLTFLQALSHTESSP